MTRQLQQNLCNKNKQRLKYQHREINLWVLSSTFMNSMHFFSKKKKNTKNTLINKRMFKCEKHMYHVITAECSCIKRTKTDGVVIRVTAEGAFLLSSRLFPLRLSFLPLSVFALDLPAASLLLTSTSSRPTLARRWSTINEAAARTLHVDATRAQLTHVAVFGRSSLLQQVVFVSWGLQINNHAQSNVIK